MALNNREVAVAAVQTALKNFGHDVGPTDGDLGPRTVAAITAFQSSKGLTVTGRLNSKTMDLLGADLSATAALNEVISA